MIYVIRNRDGEEISSHEGRLAAVRALAEYGVGNYAATRMLDCADGQRPAEDYGYPVTVDQGERS